MKNFIRSLTPAPLLNAYHLVLAYLGALWCGFPSRKLVVIAVTGTKGKSTTTELIAAVLRASGKKVAVASTIHFVIGEDEEPNLFKMTMPGRFFLQTFLRRAVAAGCTYAVIEMTSEGARQYRHRGIALDALVFLNLSPEHIESHGSFQKYGEAKLSLAHALAGSSKRPRIIVANADDAWGEKFLDVDADIKAPFKVTDAEPYNVDDKSIRFVWRKTLFSVPMPGLFSLKNCLATLTLGEALGLPIEQMKKGLEHIRPIAGRVQRIEQGQPFTVIVDNAHTPDSLEALFEAFKNHRCIGLIGSMGGGRDTWNRPVKGKIADTYCDVVIITDEDPCDEDPRAIADALASGATRNTPLILMDRREAIGKAFKEAGEGDVVLITGKGTDPYILGPKGTKTPWSDARIAAEELQKLGYHN